MKRSIFGLCLATTALGFAVLMPTVSAQPSKDAPIKIGMVRAFFNDIPEVMVQIAVEPFTSLMKQATGLKGELQYKDDAFEIARKLSADEIQVGVFHGHEFAWVQKKYPKLTPLMIAVNKQRDVRAFVVVAKDSKCEKMDDLRGKTLAMPVATKEHCRIFLDGHCKDNTGKWQTFFKQVPRSTSTPEALDDICRGKCDAVIVDTLGLEFYKSIKGPFFAKNLRVLHESDEFPAPVICVKDGVLPKETVQKLRDGLTNAHKLADAQDLFLMWQIDGFESIPATYSKSLIESLKRYPAPAPAKVSMR
jgi:ABC-type phosphate/phosphonate transport system substrate-binding protein